jgi:hypothetical protein
MRRYERAAETLGLIPLSSHLETVVGYDMAPQAPAEVELGRDTTETSTAIATCINFRTGPILRGFDESIREP